MRRKTFADYDGAWKEALRRFFPAFLALLFPQVYADIDWRRKFEFLDKEFQNCGSRKRSRLSKRRSRCRT
jgi:hypothetical protein